jgi:hypothetical protein
MNREEADPVLTYAVAVTHEMRGCLEEPRADSVLGARHLVVEESDHGLLRDVFGYVGVAGEPVAIAHQGCVMLLERGVEIQANRGFLGDRPVIPSNLTSHSAPL